MPVPTFVVLAAGQGSRMRSATPKVMHDLCGRPLVDWPVAAAREVGGRIVIVDRPAGALVGHYAGQDDVVVAVQPQPDGTAGAVAAAGDHLPSDAPVVVLAGDVPLMTADALRALLATHGQAGAAATIATMRLADPSGYGRIVRGDNGHVERVVETKVPGDATAAELLIDEVNTGLIVFEGAALRDALPQVGAHTAQGERYLPDVLPVLRAAGASLAAHEVADADQALGVNDRRQLAQVRAIAQQRIFDRLIAAGVTIVAPAATSIDVCVELGEDTLVEPGVVLRGATRAGARCHLGPHSTLIDVRLGDDVTINHTYATDAEVHDRVSVGPFAYLRPGTVLREGSKVGTYVEIKNSDIGAGAKVPHLSYIGDADVGERTNLGAGTITANYDGRSKHRTTIGARVHGGVDTSFVAPVTVGDDAWTAAGSVITSDVPPGALGVARQRQRNIEGFDARQHDEV
jgi:bifunctional UDP-N-acetylglucosamine pyrophosphorylase/glucosamine-1-phosphate N-acetyltransferase